MIDGPTERAIDALVALGSEDEVPYVSLPLKPAFYVKVRYKDVGKLPFVPYPLEEQEWVEWAST